MKVLECKLDQMIEMNKELESDNRRLRYVLGTLESILKFILIACSDHII